MLCSISTQKSGSNWLDRLRSSKGFSFADHQTPIGSNSISPDAETQLRDNNNNNVCSESSSDPIRSVNEPAQTPAAPGNSGDNEQLCNVVTDVLSELFCMGESNSFPKFNFKKGSRKQTSPRFCASSEINNAASPMSDGNSRVEIKESQVKLLEQGSNLNVAEEEDKSHPNLLGFSRTEVMVIDTSCAPWKFEKFLFRKKNVWKVRDKKSKVTSVGNKKRKKADVVNEDVAGEKKQKMLRGNDGCGSSKDEKGGVCKFPVNEELWFNDLLEETCTRTSDSVGQPSKKKQRNLKLKRASSSVVLIKSIPTSKKNGTGIAKNCLKPSHRHYKAQ